VTQQLAIAVHRRTKIDLQMQVKDKVINKNHDNGGQGVRVVVFYDNIKYNIRIIISL
jgi:hypothetical protein